LEHFLIPRPPWHIACYYITATVAIVLARNRLYEANRERETTSKRDGGNAMKKLIVLVLVVLGLLAIMPAMEIDSSTQVFSRTGFAEGGD